MKLVWGVAVILVIASLFFYLHEPELQTKNKHAAEPVTDSTEAMKIQNQLDSTSNKPVHPTHASQPSEPEEELVSISSDNGSRYFEKKPGETQTMEDVIAILQHAPELEALDYLLFSPRGIINNINASSLVSKEGFPHVFTLVESQSGDLASANRLEQLSHHIYDNKYDIFAEQMTCAGKYCLLSFSSGSTSASTFSGLNEFGQNAFYVSSEKDGSGNNVYRMMFVALEFNGLTH